MNKEKYIIVKQDSIENLEAAVNQEIKDGYLPIGGVLAVKRYSGDESYYISYAQPMLLQPSIELCQKVD